ncbi:MAG: hypothetical protein AABY97_03945 [Chloroflexota bacterium]
MQSVNIDEVLEKILDKDPSYHREAYLFLREGLDLGEFASISAYGILSRVYSSA